MTTQQKSGTEDSIQVEGDLTQLKAGEGVSFGDTKYEYASDLQVEPTPLVDPATGKTVSIRLFEFKMSPDPMILKNFPNQQTLFNAHAKQISTILWSDGMRPLEEVAPRVIINKKLRTYQIFVPCEPRLNMMVMETPRNLNDVLK